jgi:hypothetical protein
MHLISEGGDSMTANISTNINVYFGANGSVQYSPNNQLQVPADTVETVIWKGIGPLRFIRGGFHVTALTNIAPGRIDVLYAGATGDTDTVTMKIDNTGGPANVAAAMDFKVVDISSPRQPPLEMDGGGSIRNKGNSIWVWELVLAPLGSLFAGLLIGLQIAPSSGPLFGPLAALIAALAVGVAAGLALKAVQYKARSRAS